MIIGKLLFLQTHKKPTRKNCYVNIYQNVSLPFYYPLIEITNSMFSIIMSKKRIEHVQGSVFPTGGVLKREGGVIFFLLPKMGAY